MSRFQGVLFAALLACGANPDTVCAQVGGPLTSGTPFPVSVVDPGGALAADVNPAALSTLRSWAMRFEHVRGADGTIHPDRRSAGLFALPTRYGLALGLGLESVRAGAVAQSPSHRGLTWAGSLGSGSAWSLGGAWRLRFPQRGGPTAHTADLSLAFRPAPTLGFALLGRNLAIETARLGLAELERTGLLAAQLRPLGDDRVWLELTAGVREGSELSLRAAAGVSVPWLGAVSVAGELDDRTGKVWLLSAGVRAQWGGTALEGVMYAPDSFDDPGWGAAVEFQGRARPGLPQRRYVAELKLESGGARGILNAVAALDRALHDPRVRGVLLRPRSSGAGLAAAQEVRLMVDTLRAAGKPVYCYLEAPSGAEYYLCAGADRVTLDPAGNIQLMGLTTRTLMLGDLIKKVGLRADFVRIGRYKSAPEQYTNRASTPAAREQREVMLDDTYRRMISDLARDRGQTEAQMRAVVDRGPFVSEEAEQDHLVAASLDGSEVNGDLKQVFGPGVAARPLAPATRPHRYGPTGQIGVVVIDGAIVNGPNQDIPIIGVHTSGAKTVVESLDQMAANPRVRAVVLRVDSPGGAVLASDQIWRAVQRLKKKKPVVASMGSVAASGGYFVASAATEIWASPATVTGSIGIFYGKVDVAPLADMLDIGIEEVRRGAHAGADSIYRPFTDEERSELVKKIRFWYRQFLERVAEGRGMDVAAVDKLARGRIYSGDRAKQVGLVDSLGGFGSALARARQLAGLSPAASLVVLPRRPSSLLEYVLGAQVKSDGPVPETASKPWPLIERLSWLRMLDGTQPLALWDQQLVVE